MRSMREKLVLRRMPSLPTPQSTLMGCLALFGVALGGCTSPTTTTNTAATSSRDVTVPDRDADINSNTAAGKKLKIAVIPKGLSHAFWQTVKKGADDAGAQMNAQIIWNGPSTEGEVGRQVQIVEDLITQKVDGIVLAPIDRKALVAAIEKASTEKVALTIFDSDANTPKRLSLIHI